MRRLWTGAGLRRVFTRGCRRTSSRWTGVKRGGHKQGVQRQATATKRHDHPFSRGHVRPSLFRPRHRSPLGPLLQWREGRRRTGLSGPLRSHVGSVEAKVRAKAALALPQSKGTVTLQRPFSFSGSREPWAKKGEGEELPRKASFPDPKRDASGHALLNATKRTRHHCRALVEVV